MICQQCKKNKKEIDFYLIDGGLGYRNDRIHWCKECIKNFNDSRERNKYLDEQCYAQYYGALEVLKGVKLRQLSENIENGIQYNSNYIGIQNYLYIITNGEKGRKNSSQQQKKVYDLLSKNNYINSIIYPDDINDKSFLEGTMKTITVNAYERNPKARQECIVKYGCNCFICGFNFEKKYGVIGREFIHVHHIKPLSEIKEKYEIKVEDLRPVCPNCHAMLHKRIPAYSIEEIKSLIVENDL